MFSLAGSMILLFAKCFYTMCPIRSKGQAEDSAHWATTTSKYFSQLPLPHQQPKKKETSGLREVRKVESEINLQPSDPSNK